MRSNEVADVKPSAIRLRRASSTPADFERIAVSDGSFGAYLRSLPLEPAGAPVLLFDGRRKSRDDVHAAVIDLDVGPRDLQQCADSILRLRAEYLFGIGRLDDIAFHFTSGFLCAFARWRAGDRVTVNGSAVAWTGGGAPDSSHDALRRYLDVVFTYAGTRSLPLDLVRAPRDSPMAPGDVYLRAGSPGHAMVVVDVATVRSSCAMLLAQGYMPAQQIHVVRNPSSPDGSPWYRVGDGETLTTPEWRFAWDDRWRFADLRSR